MTTVEILKEARALVARGWNQCNWRAAGCYCPAGAITYVISGGEEVCGGNLGSRAAEAYDQAIDALANAAGLRSGVPEKREAAVFAWNDAPERTAGDVLAAFDRAVALAEGGAS